MVKEVNNARNRDRRNRAGNRLAQNSVAKDNNEDQAILQCVARIRIKYAGYVLRRDSNSVDNEGHPLSELDPPCYAILALNMYPRERELYNKLLEDTHNDRHVSVTAQKVSEVNSLIGEGGLPLSTPSACSPSFPRTARLGHAMGVPSVFSPHPCLPRRTTGVGS